MQPSGHRLRDIEHHPLLTDNDNYDSASSSSSETDMADRVWFIRDGCGMVCAVMTWLLVVYADFVVTFVMLLPSKDFWYSVVNGVLFNCLAVLALSSHLRTMLTDPYLQEMHSKDGPSLPVGEQLRRGEESEVLRAFHHVHSSVFGSCSDSLWASVHLLRPRAVDRVQRLLSSHNCNPVGLPVP